MSGDTKLRAAERLASIGSPSDVAASLVERMRRGTLYRERIELAAHAGSAAARIALTGDARNGWMPWRISTAFGRERHYDEDTYQWHVLDSQPFREWLRDVHRFALVGVGGFPNWALRLAAWAAASFWLRKFRLSKWADDLRTAARVEDALDAVREWLDDPTHPIRDAGPVPWHQFQWEPVRQAWLACNGGSDIHAWDSIEAAVADFGEPTIRDAICDALVSYALGAQ